VRLEIDAGVRTATVVNASRDDPVQEPVRTHALLLKMILDARPEGRVIPPAESFDETKRPVTCGV